jgi:uncharacterized DUF497 family protein
MELEWDEVKRQWTLDHRGLDFADVDLLDPATIVTQRDLRYDYGEPRFASFGYLDGVLINVVWTLRAHRIRIISMRKANDRERKRYQAP